MTRAEVEDLRGPVSLERLLEFTLVPGSFIREVKRINRDERARTGTEDRMNYAIAIISELIRAEVAALAVMGTYKECAYLFK